jgi:predicted metal-binding membrane protein
MESALLRRPPARSRPIEIGLVVFILVLAAAAWGLTDDRMAGMDAGPGTDLSGLGWFLGIWVTMMAAMMFPSFAPMVLAYARIEKGHRGARSGPTAATALFVTGYLVAWAAAGLLGYTIIEAVRSLDLSFLAWDELGPYVAGGVILGAALYELTPAKDSCLRQCRSPRMLDEHWRPGYMGALQMGVQHGGFCVGCCWGLMAALFALGVMSISWMFVVAALIAAEKLLPWPAIATRGVAVVLAVLAIAIAFAPEDLPWLTIPGSPEAMEAMGMESDQGAMGESMRESESTPGKADDDKPMP